MYFYYCKECDYIFPTKIKDCPICEENNIKSRLLKYESPYKFSEKIAVTDLNYW